MNKPKRHHFVPRFYLSRFTNVNNQLWVFDKETGKSFQSSLENIACQNNFYTLDQPARDDIDSLEMESQFASLEREFSNISHDWFQQMEFTTTLTIPEINRDLVSLYIVTQLLRTAEVREQLVQFSNLTAENYDARKDAKNLQIMLLWDDDFVNKMKKRISECIWVFGKNDSSTPFITSDNPILIKTSDSRQWMTGPRVFDNGMYVVFPLSPTIVMYCKSLEHWKAVKQFENSITPIEFHDDIVKHENSGQIGMSNRFIFSSSQDFSFAKEFLAENSHFKNPKRERF